MLIYVKLFITALCWGGTFVAGRVLCGSLGPFSAAFLRFALAGALMFWLVRRFEGGLHNPGLKGLVPVLLLGATGVFAYNAFFFTGLATVDAGRAAVIVAINPIFIALFSALIFKEALTRVRVAGIAMSVGGAWLVISRGRPLELLSGGLGSGELAILGCVASWVSYSLLGKKVMGSISPVAAVTWSCVLGGLMLFPFALATGLVEQAMNAPWTAWVAVVYLGVFGTVLGFTWFYEGVKTIGPSRAGVFINFVPMSAIILGYLFLGESLDTSLILGGLVVCVGVYLTNRSPGGTSRKGRS